MSMAASVRLKFKPKECWEDAAWFHSNFSEFLESTDIETSRATLLHYPNMIFLSIGHGSTALLEGIACAVPCMIAREQDTADYIDLGNVIPVGNIDTICNLIDKCRNNNVYNELLKAQIRWFRVQTSRNRTNQIIWSLVSKITTLRSAASIMTRQSALDLSH